MSQIAEDHPWWKKGVIYQIYPRSFADSNGDGIGDLAGITSRLEHCRWLGVDAIWLSPFYPSPMIDFGYDVSDYVNIDPMFGTLEDFDQLIVEAHRLGLRVLIDYVPNHSSDQHRWFQESRLSRTSRYRDWYIWRDPAPGGGPPTNWRSVFGGSAWTWDSNTQQYYFHSYLMQQPDLNWRNPELQEAMLNVLRFWLKRGVDGFRVDAISRLMKDEQFRDNPVNPLYKPEQGPYHELLATYSADLPEVHTIVNKIRRGLDEYGGRVMIGEAYLPLDRMVTYYGLDEQPGVHFPFNFQLIRLPWDARVIASAIDSYEAALRKQNWPNWVLGNHDRHRVATRVGPAQARVAAMLQLTLRGTPTIYYGEEIGMEDVQIPQELVQDPWEKNVPGLGFGRDPERTPMQWDDSHGAGFTTGTPWLPLHPEFRSVNVAAQQEVQGTMLALYRQLLQLRREEPALNVGAYRTISVSERTLMYVRSYERSEFLVALNLGDQIEELCLDHGARGRVWLSTLASAPEVVGETIRLRPNEGLIIKVAR